MSFSTTSSLDLTSLYKEHKDGLYAYVYTIVQDSSLTEDIVSTTSHKAFSKWKLFNKAKASEKTWLYTIARNTALDELRKNKFVKTPLEDQRDSHATEDFSHYSDIRLMIQEALQNLSVRERELIGLKFYTGLTNREIAQLVHLSESAVGTNLHRAITTLRKVCNE